MAVLIIRVLNREIHSPLEKVKKPLTCTKAGDPITIMNDGQHPGKNMINNPKYRFVKIDGKREAHFDLFEERYDGLFTSDHTPKVVQKRKFTYTGLMKVSDFSADPFNPTLVSKVEFTEKL